MFSCLMVKMYFHGDYCKNILLYREEAKGAKEF